MGIITIPDIGNRYWDVWQDAGLVESIIPALGSPSTVWPTRPDWMPETCDSILDAGCGSGVYYPAFRRLFPNAKYIGIDTSVFMLERAYAAFPEDRDAFQYGDIFNLPFDENSIDFVFVNAVFIHLPHINEALAELWRVARKWVCFNIYAGKKNFAFHCPDGSVLFVVSYVSIANRVKATCNKNWLSSIIVERTPVSFGGGNYETLRYLVAKKEI